jgi:hypothetical protein
MRIYKFRDLVDGRYAFVLAKTPGKANEALEQITSIKFELVGSKSVLEIDKPIIWKNDILPF